MEWISVKDRFPTNESNFLGTDGEIIFAAYYCDDTKSYKVGGWENCHYCGGSSDVSFVKKYYSIKKITHWMLLPNPPEKHEN